MEVAKYNIIDGGSKLTRESCDMIKRTVKTTDCEATKSLGVSGEGSESGGVEVGVR